MKPHELCFRCQKNLPMEDDIFCTECVRGLPSWLKAEDGTYVDEPVFKRNRPRLKDRLRPCEWCGHPLTQRHHQLPFEEYGEMSEVLHLCANCHEIYHVYWGWRKHRQKRAFFAMHHLERRLGYDDPRLAKAREAVQGVLEFLDREEQWAVESGESREKVIRERKLIQSRIRRQNHAKSR